jgi:hypothetical protein
MFYDIDSTAFELSGPIPKEALEEFDGELPGWLRDLGNGRYKVELHDEGFFLEEAAPILSLAKGTHTVRVHFSDHKGASSYDVRFGNGECSET